MMIPETGFVEINGTKLYFEVMGEGHPLVLIHGGYMDRRMWDDQFATFAEHYRVIRYDVRGFGKTELPPTPYADRQDLYELLKFLGINKTYLLGLSLGGAIAIDFTIDHPEMVDALILVGSSINGAPMKELYSATEIQAQMQLWTPFEQAIREQNIPAMVDALMEHPTLVPTPQYPAARQHVRENLSEYSFAWVLNPAPKQELTPSAWQRLAQIAVPTLIIVGGNDDVILHRYADRLEHDITGSRRVTISETHHMPNMEKPEEFNQIILNFLDSL